MKIIGIGDLVTDYYYKDSKFLGLCGGMTVFNVLANLASKYETYAIGMCGNDEEGDIAINSLKVLNVNVDNIKRGQDHTRCFHINITKDGVLSKKRCPICGRKKWYEDSEEMLDIPKSLLAKDNLFVFDTINKRNLKLIKNIKSHDSKIAIDIGQVGKLEDCDAESIIEKLSGKFNLVQLNERVYSFLMNKFNFSKTIDINQIFESDLIIITYGKNGSKFVHGDKVYSYNLEKPSKEVDPTGAGDLFLSTVIKCVLENNFEINEKILDEANKQAVKNTSQIVKRIGARSMVEDLYKKTSKKDRCICGLEIEKERKKVKKIDTNLSVLKKRIEADFKSNAYEEVKTMIDNVDSTTVFCGTGGSYAAAFYGAEVVNQIKGIYTEAMYPRVAMYKNMNSVGNIIAFSYSGSSNDIVEVLKKCKKQNKYIITKAKKDSKKPNLISYRNPKGKAGRERGFLSIEGTIVPASFFAKYYYEKEKIGSDFDTFMYERLDYWNNYWKDYFKTNHKELKNIFKEKGVIDTFYGDYTTSATLDLESKIVESGVYRITMHEKKNFSHGRFISMEHNNSNVVIYFKTKSVGMYEKKLLKYLKENANSMIMIESEYENLLGEFDLLLSVQYLTKYIADLIDKDLSKPAYSEEAMKIYRHTGKI